MTDMPHSSLPNDCELKNSVHGCRVERTRRVLFINGLRRTSTVRIAVSALGPLVVGEPLELMKNRSRSLNSMETCGLEKSGLEA